MPESTEPASPRPIAKMTRGEWALILVLVAIQFTHMVDFVIIMPLGDTLMKELEISPTQFGLIVSTYAIAAGVASLIASLSIDRFDRKSVLLTMYAGFGLSTLFCGLASSYETLLLARTLAGIFGGLAAVAIMAVIGDVFPPEKRGRATGAITSSFSVASIFGLPLGLLLVEWYGRGTPFVVLAALSLLVWLTGYFRLPQVRGHLDTQRSKSFAELKQVMLNVNYQKAFLFTFFLVLGTFTVASFIAPYLQTLNGWTKKDLAKIYMVAGTWTFIGTNVIGQLADRMQRLLLFRIFGLAALLLGVVLSNLPETPLYIAAIAMSGFMVCATGRFIPAQAMIIGVAEPKVRGAFMSLNTAVQHLATGIAPLIAGCCIGTTEDGKLTGFPLVGLIAAVAAAISLVLGGLLRPAPNPKPADSKPDGATDVILEAAAA